MNEETKKEVTDSKTTVAEPTVIKQPSAFKERPANAEVVVRPSEARQERAQPGYNTDTGIKVFNLGSKPVLVVPREDEDGKTVRELVNEGFLRPGEFFVNGRHVTEGEMCFPGDSVVSTPTVRGGVN